MRVSAFCSEMPPPSRSRTLPASASRRRIRHSKPVLRKRSTNRRGESATFSRTDGRCAGTCWAGPPHRRRRTVNGSHDAPPRTIALMRSNRWSRVARKGDPSLQPAHRLFNVELVSRALWLLPVGSARLRGGSPSDAETKPARHRHLRDDDQARRQHRDRPALAAPMFCRMPRQRADIIERGERVNRVR